MKLTKLTFSGDIMLNSEILKLYKNRNKKYNFDSIFENIKEFLNKSDFVVGNLETPISLDYNDIKYEKYQFTSPVEFAEAIKKAGFDLVSTANNHCLDNGIKGIKKTIESLESVGLKNTGVFYKNENLDIENINDIKIGFLSYTYGTNAFTNNVYLDNSDVYKVNLLQKQELSNCFVRKFYKSKNFFVRIVRKIFSIFNLFQFNKPVYERIENNKKLRKKIVKNIDELKKRGAEYIVFCMHEGGQYNEFPLPKTQKTVNFLKENGVDLIIGNHEHVVQKIEKEGKQIVTYSLGNFFSANGVISAPFDKMAEYSILLNVYLKKSNSVPKVNKVTFTILKTLLENKNYESIKVMLLSDLINNCNDRAQKNKLMEDNKKIVKRITGKDILLEDIKEEYEID